MKKFVLIFGPGAVGKMTVGRSLAEKSGLKLFHNHQSLEIVNQYFDFGTPPFRRLSEMIRFEFFREIAASDLPGLIFTFVWAFDLPKEQDYVDSIVDIFQKEGAEIYFVELEASIQKRKERNKTELRLAEKPSKRDVPFSENMLVNNTKKHRMNSLPGEINIPDYIKINNENLSADEVSDMIIESFNW